MTPGLVSGFYPGYLPNTGALVYKIGWWPKPPVLSDVITYISVLWMRCSIQCSSVYPLIGYLSYRDSKLNVGITLFFVHQVLPFFHFRIRLDTSPYGHESLTIILCWGPKHKMIVKFWLQVLTRTCTKILK